MNCPAPGRVTWWKECLTNIRKHLDANDTAYPIKELLLEGLHATLHNLPSEAMAVHPSVANVAESQASIGWHQILKGQFSKLWATTQDRYLGSHSTVKVNWSQRMIQVIESILVEWIKLWKLRNKDRHGRDVEPRRQAETRQTIQELDQFYNTHDRKVTARLQWIFSKPMEERREQNIGIIIQWLNTWKSIVKNSYNTALTTGWLTYKKKLLPLPSSNLTQQQLSPPPFFL